MLRRFLASLGVLSLAILVVAALVAVIAARQSIRIQIGPERDAAEARGPDPLALLGADVAQLRADLDALGAAIAAGLESQARALHEDALARERSLHAELAGLRAELARSQAAWDELATQRSAAPTVAVDEPAPAPEALAAADEPAPVPEPLTESPAQPAARGASFLAFELPTRALDFERPQRFALVPSLSRVGFDASSTVHDFSGATDAVAGEFETVLARPGELARGSVRVEAARLDTGEPDRDANMRTHLGVAEHPEITFTWTAFEPEGVDVATRSVRGTARGELEIRGTTLPFALPVRVGVDAAQRLTIEGEATLDMNDFGVHVPKKLGLISVDPEVKVWIALRARNVGAAQTAADAR